MVKIGQSDAQERNLRSTCTSGVVETKGKLLGA